MVTTEATAAAAQNGAVAPASVQGEPVQEAAWSVVCLCAAWCGVCRDYQATFERLALAHPGVSFRWSDVEEDEDTADIEVETFPTLRISQGGAERFFGPVLPQAQPLTRLLRSLMTATHR